MRSFFLFVFVSLISTLNVEYSFAQSATVTITSAVKKSYSGSDISCSSAKDGEITVSAAGGSGKYEYSKDNGATFQKGNVFSNLAPGANYIIVVRDANNKSNKTDALYVWMSGVNAVTISSGPQINKNISCYSANDGQISLTAWGGSGNLQYSINNGVTYQSGNLFSNLAPGTYKIIVKDQNGCSATSSSITLNSPAPVTTIITSQTDISCGSNTGSVTIKGSGSIGDYNASIDGGSYNWFSRSNTYTFTGLTAGIHQIAIQDNFTQCAGSITVNIISSFSASISGNSSICSGNTSNFVINISAGSVDIFTAIYKDNEGNNYTVNKLIGGNNTITTGVLTASKTFTLVSVKNASGCSASVSGVANIIVTASGQWLGNTTNWNDGTNWSCGMIPSSGTNVTIPATANNPVIPSGTFAVNNITIVSGAGLAVNGTLQIAGKITNSGTFDATKGTIELNSRSPQTFSGSSFVNKTINNLKVSNTSLSLASTINDTLKITGTVSFGVSNSTFNTNDNLTIKSTSTATGSISDITNGGIFSGNKIIGKVTVERFLNTGVGNGLHGKKWLYLATPTTGQSIKESWMENGSLVSTGYGIQVTGAGGAANGFDLASPSPSMKYYDEATTNWIGVSNTANSIYNSKGYMVFVRGDRSVNGSTVATPNSVTLRTKGTINNGDQKILIPASSSFASVGNPYASAIDMRKVTQNNGSTVFYVWNPSLGGVYGYGAYETYFFNGTNYISVPGNKVNNFIQSGQAFFVQTTKTAGSIVIKETSKANSSSTSFFKPQGTTERQVQLQTTLYGLNADGSTSLADGALQQFGEDYSNDIDLMDAKKFYNTTENLSIRKNGQDLVVEKRQLVNNADTIFYNITGLKAQKYRFEIVATNFNYDLQPMLEDTYLKTSTPINIEETTNIDFTVNNVAASYAANRFRIIFSKMAAPLPVTFTSVKATQKNTDIAVEWKTENESNMQQFEVEKSTDGNKFIKVAAVSANNAGASVYNWLDKNVIAGYNYYRIRSVDINGQTAYTQIVKVLTGKISAEINVYPNPATNRTMNLQLTDQPAGAYYVRLINPIGQVILSKQILHAEGSSTESVKVNDQSAKGIYQLEITKPNGDTKVIKVIL